MRLSEIFRVLSLVLLSVATGGIVRYYTTRPQMKWMSFLGVCCATFCMAASVITRIAHHPPEEFVWWVTPPVILYSVFVIIAMKKFLVLRDRRQPDGTSR